MSTSVIRCCHALESFLPSCIPTATCSDAHIITFHQNQTICDLLHNSNCMIQSAYYIKQPQCLHLNLCILFNLRLVSINSVWLFGCYDYYILCWNFNIIFHDKSSNFNVLHVKLWNFKILMHIKSWNFNILYVKSINNPACQISKVCHSACQILKF